MKTNVLECRSEPAEGEIQKAAYFLWLELGRPEGRDQETWFAAKELLRHRLTGLPGSGRRTPPPHRRALKTTLTLSHPTI